MQLVKALLTWKVNRMTRTEWFHGRRTIIDFSQLAINAVDPTIDEIDDLWAFLARDYKSVFTGFDYKKPVSAI